MRLIDLVKSPLLHTLATLLVSAIITFACVPVMIKIANKTKMLDYPAERKSHDKATPLLGGVAIFIGTLVSILLFARSTGASYVLFILSGGIFGVMFMGLLDDMLNLSAKLRLVILFIMATAVVIGCTEVLYGGITRFVNNKTLYYVFIVFMIIWTVAITNAINWSDGLDGLAATQSFIAVCAFAVIFYLQGRTTLVYPVAVALGGALLGFLPFNFSPAKLFMGDAGSMFIGFILGVLSISSVMHTMSIGAIVIPIYILLLPIADMGIAIIRRLVNKQPIIEPDKRHIHHLLKQHYSTKTVVLIIGLIQAVSATLGVLIYIFKLYTLGWFVFIVGFLAVVAITVVTAKANARKKTDS